MNKFIAAGLLWLAAGLVPAFADPVTIRLGYPGVGADNRQYANGELVAVAHAGHFLEDEFANDPNVKIQWTFFRGAGPALNESLASGQLDFAAGLGDLPSLVGRANGLKTLWIAGDLVRNPIYLAVQPKSGITKVEDLKGHKVSEFKGTNVQLLADRALALHGLDEHNLHFINLDFGSAVAALAGGDIDASFGAIELLELRKRGIIVIPYSTKQENPPIGRNQALFVTEAFEKAHPDLVQRVVNAYVKAARFASDEANREKVFELWAKSGYPVESFRADFENEALAHRLDPLLDDYVLGQYRDLAKLTRQYGLLRKDVDVDSWIQPKYLQRALAEQHLEHFWPTYDASGKKVSDGDVEHTWTASK